MGGTLWLIGMMGAGKSTIAPLVAEMLDVDWIDSDEAVEHLSGRRIVDLFAESEDAFRQVEAEVIEEIAGADLVVACGGGVVTQPDLALLMRSTGPVVWLRASVATLAERTREGSTRPLLGDRIEESLQRILEQRAGLYGAVATVTVDTDGRTPDDVAAEVVSRWNESSGE